MAMQCQIFDSEHGFIRCEYWDRCQTSGVCLCETEVREAAGLPSPTSLQSNVVPWTKRREQVLAIVEQHGIISTAFLMAEIGGAYTTTTRWLTRLVKEGELKRLTRAVKKGPETRPATFTLREKGD